MAHLRGDFGSGKRGTTVGPKADCLLLAANGRNQTILRREPESQAAVSPLVLGSGHLQRFIDAQANTFSTVQRELSRGQKTTHWMWFIFPQLQGLGSSEMARVYAIASLDEARAFLAHPLLGVRLRECVKILQELPHVDAQRVFGTVDALKLRSSLTLFLRAGGGGLFEAALKRWFDGQTDERTEHLIDLEAIEDR